MGWGKLASLLKGGDIRFPPGTPGSLRIGDFLSTHRGVVGEGLRNRREHPWRFGGGRELARRRLNYLGLLRRVRLYHPAANGSRSLPW